ncbi:MAG: PEP-CTERM sorting domain-containing protein [Planctomycetota bacterium]|jgi:hypothetical protein
MEGLRGICVATVLTLCLAAPCDAGFLMIIPEISEDGLAPAKAPPDLPAWDFIPSEKPGGPAFLSVFERLNDTARVELLLMIFTDADPILHITKEVENNTDATWTCFTIKLVGPDVSFVPDSASSDKLTTVSQPDLYTIICSEPTAVLPGETVTFTFDVLAEAVGDWTLSLEQTPIPEPATVALIGLGVFVLLRKARG